MSFRTILILFNVGARSSGSSRFVVYRVVSLRRNPEAKQPENLTPFFDDDVLEGAHLERALGVALIALVVVVLGLLAYFIWEPFRGADASDGLQGAARSSAARCCSPTTQSKEYDSTKSLLCADCHGIDGGGGSAHFVVKSEDPRCDPNQTVNAELADEAARTACPQQVAWAAPSLQLASLRYDREQLTQIITYGRPGTPMPAWGVVSGKGVLQEQSIQRPRELRREPRHHARQGAGGGATKELEKLRPRRVRGRKQLERARDAGRRRQVGRRRPGRARRRRRRRSRTRPASRTSPVHQARAAEAGDPRRSPRTGSETTQSRDRRRSCCS